MRPLCRINDFAWLPAPRSNQIRSADAPTICSLSLSSISPSFSPPLTTLLYHSVGVSYPCRHDLSRQRQILKTIFSLRMTDCLKVKANLFIFFLHCDNFLFRVGLDTVEKWRQWKGILRKYHRTNASWPKTLLSSSPPKAVNLFPCLVLIDLSLLL